MDAFFIPLHKLAGTWVDRVCQEFGLKSYICSEFNYWERKFCIMYCNVINSLYGEATHPERRTIFNHCHDVPFLKRTLICQLLI